jgi:DHA2 family multidrug resistance protein
MTAASGSAPAVNRTMAVVSIMLTSTMTQLDTTIANVALPHMAGSMSASPDQITWVLTSYIISAAIVTPMTGWLAGRFGRRRIYIVSVIGFTLASALCGASQSLGEIVLARVLQGVFGATMLPLSQAVITDLYPPRERGQAMAIWSLAALVAPIAGPILGGWLTEDHSWRWVFYINLPIGVLALAGVVTFMPGSVRQNTRFDVVGFILLSIALAAAQLCLDRGQARGWFGSTEIVLEACIGALAFILFLINNLTAEQPFMPRELFTDRNFVAGSILGFMLGMLAFSVLALLPTMMQSLLGYPVITSGFLSAPRGLGSVISMSLASRLANRVDMRVMMFTGIVLLAVTFFQMSGFSLQMNFRLLIITAFFQGLGSGMAFMPLAMMVIATLPAAFRADGAGVTALIRNLGNSFGIAILEAMLTRNTAAVHARLAEQVRLDNPLFKAVGGAFRLTSPQNIAMVAGEIGRQASMVAYIDVFRMMSLVTFLLPPLVLLVRRPSMGPASASEVAAMAD